MKQRLVSLAVVIALFSALLTAALPTARAADLTVHIYPGQVLESNFMGFGVQWEPYDTDGYLTDADRSLIEQRVSFMRPPILRTMLSASWYCTGFDSAGNPTYDWNSTAMQRLYRLLDYAQRNNIEVLIGEWNDPASPGSALERYNIQENDPRWARLIADFLNQIHNVKGYSVVKYYNMVNEPNGYWSNNASWDTWKTGIGNLHAELSRRGYLSWIKLAGPDSTGADDWVNMSVDQLRDRLGAYELHRYATLGDVVGGGLEQQMRARRDYILANDPQGAAKRFFIGEAGMVEGKIENADTQPNRYSFTYGVWMADYAVQTIRAGQAGAIAWDLDDAEHVNGVGYGSLNLKGWGFWNILGGRYGYPASDRNIRPWFYTWSLLSRAFPRGSQTLHLPPSGISGLRVTAARIPAGDSYHLSVAIVNDSDTPRSISLDVLGTQGTTSLAKYHYFENDRPTDANGFPVVKERLNGVNLQSGLSVSLPSRGMVLLTTLEGGAPIPIGVVPTPTPAPVPPGTLVDNLDNWDSVAGFSPNWTFDNSNTQYFEGDTSRVKRTSDTAESITYARPNITGFAARIFYESSAAGQVKFFASPDNSAWTQLAVTSDTPVNTSASWYRAVFRPSGALPAGTNYLRVEFSNNSLIYSPQLGQIAVSYSGSSGSTPGNLALGKPAASSSDETSGLTASLAFDGNGSTRWSSAYSDPQWLQVDLGQSYAVSRVRLSWEAAYATAYKVQVSSDGASWADAYSTTAGDGGLDDISFAARSARYVRVYGSLRATPYGYSLWEFEVFGSASAPTTLTDDLADWSKTFARSANWTIDSTNPVYFDGDTGRVKRTSNTAESVTYRLGAITSFSAKVYYVNGIDSKVRFFTSPDNATWTALAVTNSAPVNTSGAWYRTTFSPAGAVPGGAGYLRVEFANDATIYSPQLAQITISGN